MGDWMTTGGLREGRRPKPLSPLREHLRDTFWFAPAATMVVVFVVWTGASGLDTRIVETLRDAGEYDAIRDLVGIAEDARTVANTISSAMMTFIGVVFSISLVAVQMASGQFTPRVVRFYVRSRITKATFAVFLSTFLLSLLVLTSATTETDPRRVTSVPLVQSLLMIVMLGLSLVLFVMYVNATLRLMRVSHVIDRITVESFRMVALMPTEGAADAEEELGPVTAWVAHRGRAGVLRDVNISRLVRAARQRDVVLRLVPRIGDFVVPGTPLLAVHGGPVPSARSLTYTVSVGVERTFHQDLALGLRQLVDIGLRALSPGVNDPTTAVQAVDRIVQFLATLSRRPLNASLHRDRRRAVRLVQPVPSWSELVDLGFAEIRGAAVGSPQVTRRLVAALDDLLLVAPEERRPPLERHRELLAEAVRRSVHVAADRAFALRPDRQGIG
ncbi:DUF2254 domain-containing protein [Streptomyces sp. MS06]|uniref:DUF2254 domain-containing protein n=1 Tax=Streptomyces sp. MS06 TaxID=3385974 RepID=UPI00399F8880